MVRNKAIQYEQSQFGKNVKYLRTSVLQITQSELAERACVAQHTISDFENNPEPNLKLRNLINISKAFNVSIDDLLMRDIESIHKKTKDRFVASDEDFAYFENKKFYLYFIPRPRDSKIVEGHLEFDASRDRVRERLYGRLSLARTYDCNLVFDENKNIYINGHGNGSNKGRRMQIAMFFPEFEAGAVKHYGGLGLLVHLDMTLIHVAQRIALSDHQIDLADEQKNKLLWDHLTDNGNTERVYVNRLCDSGFVEWLKTLSQKEFCNL